MTHKFYNRFIRPTSTDTDQAEREIILNYLLVGILALSIIAFIITLIGPLISSGVPARPDRLVTGLLVTLFIVGLYFTARYRRHYKAVAIILTLLIALLGCSVANQWSIWDPDSLLLLSLSVVMAGILIGARYSIYITCGLTLVLIYLQQGEEKGFLHPDRSWLKSQPITGDVIGISAILFVIAFVSWLFNRQMELSLRRAIRSEKALQRQKLLLEIKVEKRAQQLEAAQLDKMQELYRFAELGQLSTALFHDLANHLSTVSLDIEGLGSKGQTEIMRRIGRNVGHIDEIVQRVRQQIGGKSSVEVFNVLNEIDEVLKILAPVATQSEVTIDVEADKSIKPSLSYKGDITRFRQVILNLVRNAIEAYPAKAKPGQPRSVMVRLERQQTTLLIQVTDHGLGVSAGERSKIFRPFYTTKNKGVGIGLFIVRQVVENDFSGTVEVSGAKRQGTVFNVNLPKSYYAKP